MARCTPSRQVKHRSAKTTAECPICRVDKAILTASYPPTHGPWRDADDPGFFSGLSVRQALDAVCRLPLEALDRTLTYEVVPAKVARAILSSWSWEEAIALARNPRLDDEVLAWMIEAGAREESDDYQYDEVLRRIAGNRHASEKTALAAVRADPSLDSGETLAQRPRLSDQTVEEFCRIFEGKHHSVVEAAFSAMAKNSAISTDAMRTLLNSSSVRQQPVRERVMRSMVENRNADDAIFSAILDECSEETAAAIGRRSDVSADLLVRLMGRKQFGPALSALMNPSVRISDVVNQDWSWEMPQSPITPTVERLLRFRCAQHFGISEGDDTGALEYLLSEPEWWNMSQDDPAVFVARTFSPPIEE